MKQQKLMLKLKKASSTAQKKDYVASIKLCKELIKKSPNTIPAYKLLATNFIALKRYDEVEITLKKVIGLCKEEESYQLQHLLGCNYISQRKFNDALILLETVFNQSGDSKVLLDIAISYSKLGEHETARDIYLKLIELEPNNHQAKFNLYPILLRFKDYQGAWTCFHSRLHRQEIQEQVHWFAPAWNGESLFGKNILIYPEQGVGDNLAYTGCFAEAISDANQTAIVCDNRLKRLYKTNFPTATIISYEDINKAQSIEGNFDFQILAGSLSYLYRHTEESFTKQPLLHVDKALSESINQRLTTKKLRIGLTWFHGRVNDGNEFSMSLEGLLPVLKLDNIEWVNLQFGEWNKEVEKLKNKHNVELTHFEDCAASGDFENYASLIENLDLVIGASNAGLMLASRLGVKSWNFLPSFNKSKEPADYKDELWMKNTRYFMKGKDKDWSGVVEEISAALKLLK